MDADRKGSHRNATRLLFFSPTNKFQEFNLWTSNPAEGVVGIFCTLSKNFSLPSYNVPFSKQRTPCALFPSLYQLADNQTHFHLPPLH